MTRTLEALDSLARDRDVFTTSDFHERFGGSAQGATNALSRAVQQGLVERVARGRYAIRTVGRLSTRASTEDILLALSPLVRGKAHRVGYLTALEHHSLLLYPQPVIQVALTSPTRTGTLSGRVFRQVIEVPSYLDIGSTEADYACRVSDVPRALLDAARRPDLIGGVDTTVEALRLARPIDVPRILEYAERLNSPSALRRLGSIAQAAGREDIATEIRPEATVAATPIPIDPSSASDEIAWTDPEWNIAWDAMSMDLIGMTVER